MSHPTNEEYLELQRINYEEALDNQDFNKAQSILEEVYKAGFEEDARELESLLWAGFKLHAV